MSEDNNNTFEEEARQTANEFREGWNEVTQQGENKKVLAGILAILIGWLGIHKFILGYNKEGVLQRAMGKDKLLKLLVSSFLKEMPARVDELALAIEQP